jgi:cellulose synthase/poly-beta-1,6-N-acetylglucosamine synthase-like glycosyltransferase
MPGEPASADPDSTSGRTAPFISVIVPIYEQWHLAHRLFAALAAQSLPADRYEVIVVDNGTPLVAIPDNLPAHAQVLHCATPGSYAARNMGVQHAKGEIFAFTDADCIPDPGWLEAMAGRFDAGASLVAGDIQMITTNPKPSAVEMFDLLHGLPQRRYVSRGYAATANLAVTRALFDTVGGFNENHMSGGDAEFCRRARAAGATLVFEPGGVVRHPARDGWDDLETKARRVIGGQVRRQAGGAGFLRVLALVAARPLLDVGRFLSARHVPLHYRLTAIGVRFRLLAVEVAEVLRLRRGGLTERR